MTGMKLSIVAFAAVLAVPLAARAAAVQFVETVDNEYTRYKVTEAEGKTQDAAKKVAVAKAIVFAALTLTGSDEEKNRLEAMKDSYVNGDGLGRTGRVLKTMFFDGGIRIDVIVDVNVKELRRKLETAHLITKATDMAEELGNPTILIAPEGTDGKKLTPQEKFIVDRIASFFTSKKFDIVDQEAMKNLGEMTNAVHAMEGVIDDPIAQVAALVGADIYVTFTAGKTAEVKASAGVKAFETTTAKLLASATGESRQYPAGTAFMDALREAVSDTVPKTFEDISGYWHEDMEKGKKYMFTIAGDLSDRDRAKALRKNLEGIGTLKMTVKTDKRYGGTVRAKGSSDDIEEKIEDAIKDAGFNKVKVILSTRQLFQFSVN